MPLASQVRLPYIVLQMLGRSYLARNVLVGLFAIALAVRSLVPVGWMPSGEDAFQVTVCNGIRHQTVWVDRQGEIHKSDPSKKQYGDNFGQQTCAFSGLGLATLPSFTDDIAEPAHLEDRPIVSLAAGAIDPLLAALLPPSTGPPS